MVETSPAPWMDYEAAHPGLKELLDLPFDSLLDRAREQLTEESAETEQFADDPSGEWELVGSQILLAENEHATESLQIYASKRSISVAYVSAYKGIIGQVVQPSVTWAVARDNDGALYYWNQERHDGTVSLFTLAGTECDEVGRDSLAVTIMHWHVGLGMYLRANPDAIVDFEPSSLPPFDLKAAIGIDREPGLT